MNSNYKAIALSLLLSISAEFSHAFVPCKNRFVAGSISNHGVNRSPRIAVAWSDNQEDDPNKIPQFPESPQMVNGSKEPYDSNYNLMNQRFDRDDQQEQQENSISELDKRVLEIMRDVESKFPSKNSNDLNFNNSMAQGRPADEMRSNYANYNNKRATDRDNYNSYGNRNPSYDYNTRFDQRIGGFNSNGDSVPVRQTGAQNRQRSSSTGRTSSYLNDYTTSFDQRIGGFGGNGESLRATPSKNPPAVNREGGTRREVADYTSPFDKRVGQNRPLGSGEIPISKPQNTSSNQNYNSGGSYYNSSYDYNRRMDERVGQNRPLGSGESVPVSRSENYPGNRGSGSYNPSYDYNRSFDERVGQNRPLGSGESVPVRQTGAQNYPGNRGSGSYNPSYDYNRSFDERVGQNRPLGSGESVPVRQTGAQNRQAPSKSGRRSVIGDYTTSFDQRIGGFLDPGEPEPERPMREYGPPRSERYEYDYKTSFDKRIGGLDSNGDPIDPNGGGDDYQNRWRINR